MYMCKNNFAVVSFSAIKLFLYMREGVTPAPKNIVLMIFVKFSPEQCFFFQCDIFFIARKILIWRQKSVYLAQSKRYVLRNIFLAADLFLATILQNLLTGAPSKNYLALKNKKAYLAIAYKSARWVQTVESYFK